MTSKLQAFALITLALAAACEGDVDGGGATQADGSSGEGGSGARDGGGGTSDGGSGGRGGSGGSGGAGGSGGSGGSSGSGAMDGGGGTGAQPAQDAGMQDDAQVVDASSGETRLVVVGSGPFHNLAVSIDEGLTWCQTNHDSALEGQPFDNPHLLRNVSFSNGWFVSGSMQALFRSRNGYDWEDVTGAQDPVLGNWIGGVQFGNGYWVAAGGTGQVMRSTDMLAWNDVSTELPGSEHVRSLAFGNGVFTAGRDGVGWWQSADGTAWTQTNPSGSSNVFFDGSEFRDYPGRWCRGPLCFRNGADEIERSTDDGGSWSVAGAGINAAWGFAFGEVAVEEYGASAAIEPAIRTCLGL